MDLTLAWIFIKKHQQRAGLILIGLLLFIAGWRLGATMSPHFAAQPIIFEDRQCEKCSASGGSAEELSSLKQDGVVARDPKPSIPPDKSNDQQVAGERANAFVGSVNSDLYHHPDCPSGKRIKPANQIWFETVEQAQVAGYGPSKCTQDKLGQ